MTAAGPPGRRVAGIDALRGLSAAAVFLCHIGGYWTFLVLPGKIPQLLTLGAHGVDIFIVISGFCLTLPVLRSGGPLETRQFYGRRAWRIIPPYLVALAIATVLAMWSRTWSMVVAEPASGTDALLHLLGLQTWFPGTLGSINGSLWSVSLEMQLYLVFPLLILAIRQWGPISLLAAALVIAVAWQLASGTLTGPWGFRLGDEHALPARLIQFVIGMVCAYLVTRGRVPSTRVLWTGLLGSGLVGSLAFTANLSSPLRAPWWGLTGACAVLLLARAPWSGPGSAALETFGKRSFSFYLLHQPALLLSAPLVALIPGGWLVQVLVGGLLCFALTTALAFGLFAAVEMPAHNEGRRRFPSTTRRSAAQTA